MGFNLISGLNAGESPVSFPETVSELESAGLCQHCLALERERPEPLFTVEEIDAMLMASVLGTPSIETILEPLESL
jgi:hypothetical protein